MAIRIRKINNKTIAICAARSIEKPGDIYLDDGIHGALSAKFGEDFNSEYNLDIPTWDSQEREIEESNNPAREWWNEVYKN